MKNHPFKPLFGNGDVDGNQKIPKASSNKNRKKVVEKGQPSSTKIPQQTIATKNPEPQLLPKSNMGLVQFGGLNNLKSLILIIIVILVLLIMAVFVYRQQQQQKALRRLQRQMRRLA